MSRYRFFKDKNKMESLPPEKFSDLVTSEDDIIYRIPKGEEYRPDLIAARFYGESNLHWILTYANNFGESPEDYYVDRDIRIPHYKKVLQII